MARVIIRPDGSKMVIYSRAELRDIVRSAQQPTPPGIKAAERGR